MSKALTPQTFDESRPTHCAILALLCLDGDTTPPTAAWLAHKAKELGYSLSEQRAEQVARWTGNSLRQQAERKAS